MPSVTSLMNEKLSEKNVYENITREDIIDYLKKCFTLDDVPEDKLYGMRDYFEDKGLIEKNLPQDKYLEVFSEFIRSSAFVDRDNLFYEIFGKENIDSFCDNLMSYVNVLKKAHDIKVDDSDKNIKNDVVVLGCHNRSVQDSYASHIKWIYRCLNHFGIPYSAEGLQEIMEIHNLSTSDKSLGKQDFTSYQNNSIDAIASGYKNNYNSVAVNSDRWNVSKTDKHPLSFDSVGKNSFASQSNLTVSNMERIGEYTIYFNSDKNHLVETSFTNKHYDRQPRNMQVTLFKENGQYFQMVNLHGSWSKEKMGEIGLADTLVKTLKERFAESKLPTVIMGDFNLKRECNSIKEINKSFTNVNDVAAEADFEKIYGKKPTREELLRHQKAKFPTTKSKNNNGDIQDNYILDYILTNKAFDEKFGNSVEQYKNNEMFFGINNGNNISDHYELTFSFNAEKNLQVEKIFDAWADFYGHEIGIDVETLRDYIAMDKFYQSATLDDLYLERDPNFKKYLFLKESITPLLNNVYKLSPNMVGSNNAQKVEQLFNFVKAAGRELKNYPNAVSEVNAFAEDLITIANTEKDISKTNEQSREM